VTLEKFKHPDACYVGAELPTGRTGKLERTRLGEFVADRALAVLDGWST
jgi:hypothetical protein